MNLSDFLIIWTERTITRKSRGLGAINPQTQETPRGDGGLIPQNYRGSIRKVPGRRGTSRCEPSDPRSVVQIRSESYEPVLDFHRWMEIKWPEFYCPDPI
jgi:hypothetical protein